MARSVEIEKSPPRCNAVVPSSARWKRGGVYSAWGHMEVVLVFEGGEDGQVADSFCIGCSELKHVTVLLPTCG